MAETPSDLPVPSGEVDGVPVIDVSEIGLGAVPLLQQMELARRNGPAFVQRIHGRDTLFVSGLDLVTELADEQRFTKAVGPALVNVREFTGDGLFTAFNDEANWAKAHDVLMPAFALGSMRTYHPVMLKVARRLLDSWDRHAVDGTPVAVADDMTRMTLDTIGLAGFGFDFTSFERAAPHPFVEAMVRCLEWAMIRLGRAPGGDHRAVDAAMRADADYLAAVVDEVVTARTAGRAQPEHTDLLALMLEAVHPADGTTLDAENIRNQVITFLIAGHETTSGALSFALYYLAKHPAVLRLVQQEADDLWGDRADPEPTFEDIGRLRLTRQVLNEALRLWPTAPTFSREAREDTLLGGRIRLRAGQDVRVVVPILHRDRTAWGDNPEAFDPFRFAPAAEAARSPHAFKPFGTGERACIGRQFALHEATMLLAMLAHRYRLVDHADYRLTVKQSLTIKPDAFTLTIVPRTPSDRAANRAALRAGAPAHGVDGNGTQGTHGTQGTQDSQDPQGSVGGRQGPAGHTGPTRVHPGTGVLLLHGSNYGTCREFAARLGDAAAELGCDTVVAPLDACAGKLPTDRPVVIVAASYNGQPTDDAAAFVRWLEQAGPGSADGVRYAVLGVGDRNWTATYQRVPTLVDDRLAALGATRLLPRGEADASGELTGAVDAFTAALRTALLHHHGDPEAGATPAAGNAHGDAAGNAHGTAHGTPGYTVTELTGTSLDALATRHGLTPMTVTATGHLSRPDYLRIKRHVRLRLPEGTAYRTGDHLVVLPANDQELVERAAKVLHLDLDAVLGITPTRPRRDGLAVDRPLTVRELLTHHVELQDRPTAAQLAALAALNPCPPEQAALRALADARSAGGPDAPADPRTLLDLVEDHPALRSGALTWPALLELLPVRRPRHYSVSSSPAADPGHVDLMVSLLQGPARSGQGTYRGTGSGYLSGLRPGDTVLARLQPCREAFRIDHSATTPVIMVAAGTGLAPFRGAVADRRALLAGGARLATALLYFGCDAPDADYLHAEELRAAERAGAVSLRPAFSEAPVGGRRFVQDRVAAEADEVWSLLEAGAGVYVCGDGARMAPGVRAALETLYRDRTPGAGEADGRAWLQRLMAEGRYVEDVYAG
ncbi:bifunctional cytochrome P450/NADPH--P450 reductase [Kitasatospora sp. A2-31]|uniref:bifunctional cytochrome P450/NADPH--P450 reductase n=1 Tax=Kitasatospora sp. A2-31 TaxID=2916414 RepID=UPI001EEDD1BB|nr:cytochrome P450 [Kitasatospora sp. A2-31]MCG6499526.1 cytochrome P450 [Kitasatospora sp. A2-31]